VDLRNEFKDFMKYGIQHEDVNTIRWKDMLTKVKPPCGMDNINNGGSIT